VIEERGPVGIWGGPGHPRSIATVPRAPRVEKIENSITKCTIELVADDRYRSLLHRVQVRDRISNTDVPGTLEIDAYRSVLA